MIYPLWTRVLATPQNPLSKKTGTSGTAQEYPNLHKPPWLSFCWKAALLNLDLLDIVPGSQTSISYRLVYEFHHYFSSGLSSSKRNHHFFNGGNDFQGCWLDKAQFFLNQLVMLHGDESIYVEFGSNITQTQIQDWTYSCQNLSLLLKVFTFSSRLHSKTSY